MRFFQSLCCVALLSACSPSGEDQAATPEGQAQHLSKVPLIIEHGEGMPNTKLDIEIALTPEQQEKGLQYREDIQAEDGMIFPMVPPRMPSFWMKDTPTSLDLVFIRNDGSIARIIENAEPGSKTPLFAESPVAAVLELRAGSARSHSIDETDHVFWGACTLAPKSQPVMEADNFCPR